MTKRRVWVGALSMYGLAALTGLVAGLGAVAFEYLSRFVQWVVLENGVGYQPPGPHGEPDFFPAPSSTGVWTLGLLVVPVLGGLIAGWLCRRFAPEASGHGTDAVIDAYHNHRGQIRPRVPLVKALATAVTLGSGGSGGREGPIAQIGAGFGSWLGRAFKLTGKQRRVLLAAGMGAGVGAIFRAPLAGALFASEILYREAEFEAEAIMPSFIACSVSYCLFCEWFSDFSTLFQLSGEFVFVDIAHLLPYTILALLSVPFVIYFCTTFYGLERLFARIPGPRPLVAAMGGLLCGGVALAAWQLTGDARTLATLSQGYGILQTALDGGITGWDGARLLLLVAVLKVLTTSFTISSGGSAGVFGPSMVVGGTLGGAVGLVAADAGWAENPGTFVIVGMCGFFAGAASTPISTIIMVCEMTGSYDLLLPAMWVCGLSFLLTQRFTLYRKQAANRAFSHAHRGEYVVPLLHGLTVRDVAEERPYHTVHMETTLADVKRLIASTEVDYFPVLDADERFVGIFSAHDVRSYQLEDTLDSVVVAGDIMTTQIIRLTPDDDVHVALDRFNRKNLDELPIVASDDPSRLLGMLRRRTILRAYDARLEELRAIQSDEQ